jgi:CHAD domain-containing protein
MNHNLLNRYLHRQRKTFEACYPKVQDVTDDEAIHDIRVSIKKIRTLLLLIDFIYPGEWDIRKRYKPYRSIFRRLGSIRDLQVQQKIGNHLQKRTGKSLEGYLSFLQERETNTRQHVNEWLHQHQQPDWDTLQEEIRHYYFKTGKSTIISKAKEYVLSKISLAKELSSQNDRETVHRIRRLLKEARYMLDMMSVVLKEKFPDKKLQEMIKPVEDYLGDWHDRMVALDFLFLFEKEMVLFSPRNKINIRPAVKIVMNESNRLVKRAIREISKLDSIKYKT